MSSLSTGQQLLPGASIGRAFSLVPDLHEVTLSDGLDVATALAELQDLPWVAYAEPDFTVRTTATPDDPRFDEMWGLDNLGQTGGTSDADIDAPGAWDVHTGSGNTVVAVIDTGVDWTHPDLAENLWVNQGEFNGLAGVDDDGNGYVDDIHGYDFFNDDGNPMDDNGHGTHVAGTIGAVGNNGVGVTGVNWDVQIMGLKFLGSDGSGSGSDAIEALEYAVANGATISNNSYGGDPFSQIFLDAITAARNAGHLFVAAAGNGDIFGIGLNNDLTPFYPSGYNSENVLAVAAVDHNDQLATFSNYGATTVDVAAPGVNILSTQPGGGYQVLSGTSMATPHVTGLAALVWDANPDWTYNQVIDQIVGTVDVLPGLNGLTATGGRINAASALGNPEPPPPPPPPATLPHEDDFNDGTADNFLVRAGTWDTAGNRFNVSPSASNDEAPLYAVLPFQEPLPADLEIQARLNADQGYVEVFGIVFSDFLTNAFVIFDYQDDADFRFAGADMDNDQWVVGRYNSGTWTIDAAASETLNSAVNYDVRILIENDSNLTIEANGVEKLSKVFSTPITDGDLGLGTRNSSSHFDNLLVQEFIPPPPPAPLPYAEDFDDGLAELFDINSGNWAVESGRFRTQSTGGDAVSTLRLAEPLPADLELQATLFSELSGVQQNGFLVFDYQGPTDFKYAGAFVGTDRWAIGHRTSSGWVDDATFTQAIDTATDYDLQLVIQDDQQVGLNVDGVELVTHLFSDVVTDGKLGLAARSAATQFDDVLIQDYVPPPPPPPVTLPVNVDFDDGTADLFAIQSGNWFVGAGTYLGGPTAGSDAVSILGITETLPADVELVATLHAEPSGVQQNGFVIFDYQGPLDFKYAGAFVGANRWAIGRRTAAGWGDLETQSQTVFADTDYRLQVVIDDLDEVRLIVDGVELVSHVFGDAVNDGAIGLGTRAATSRFDDVVVQEFIPPPPPPPVTLPVNEDFEDGVADLFAIQSGSWTVEAGRYVASPIAGSDAISTLALPSPLPPDMQLSAILQAEPVGVQQNGFVIFDYQSPTDFKFAGAFVGTNKWSIGHRSSSGWIKDVVFNQTINAATDYALDAVVQNATDVTVVVDGVTVGNYVFGDAVNDGAVGIGTRQATSQFDDVLIQALGGTAAQSATSLATSRRGFAELSGAVDAGDGEGPVTDVPVVRLPLSEHERVDESLIAAERLKQADRKSRQRSMPYAPLDLDFADRGLLNTALDEELLDELVTSLL